jgi:transcription termination factor NusB
MQNQIKTKTRFAFIQFIFSTFFSNEKIFDDIEKFKNHFYKLSVPSIEKKKESVINFNINYFNKLTSSYCEFIKENDIDHMINSLINFERNYKNWSTINKSIILAIFSEIEITKKEKIKILINDYFNISKSFITKKELGMINAITDTYINEKKNI